MTAYMEFGIDLGTTNSCVARYEGDTLHVFQNNDLMNITPSVVRVLKNGRIIVGKRAYNALVDDPGNVASEFKRWMGQMEVKTFPASGRGMSPEELSAEVLKALGEDVLRATGTPLEAAVITVPAAFGALQCDATARAAALARISDSALLQEPIAAAVAYGVSPDAREQKWLVYDLGGGTFDVAVTSTRDGRLTVLEHRGDNLLGGKDVDRKIAEMCLLAPLRAEYSLPEPGDERFELLIRRLSAKAEEAKIELSSAQQTTVSLFDLTGADGADIEFEVTITRTEIEAIYEPIVRRTLQLADEALAGARVEGRDLTKILLVGGPTQAPYLRAALVEHLDAPIDHSLDPMTVVARGAALFAQTVERKGVSPAVAEGTIKVQLAYEPVSASTATPVAGKIGGPLRPSLEVRIDSRAGYWTSGWFPAVDNYFEFDVTLQEGKICPFFLYVREGEGRTLQIEPNEFTIRHGLEFSAPPLPHTISIEVVRPTGRAELDPIFPRNTLLPAEKRIHYRADHTLRPADEGTALTVKLWEGEELSEPEGNTWVGNAQIASSMIHRPIPEDSAIELVIRIDTSRLITIEIMVPHLNQHFTEGVYLAQREQQDESGAAAKLTRDIQRFTDRLAVLQEHLNHEPNPDLEATLQPLRRQLEDLDIDVITAEQQSGLSDPDRVRRLVASGRDLRTQIATLEHRIGMDRLLAGRALQARATLDEAAQLAAQYGDAVDRYEFDMQRKDFEEAAAKLDERGVRRCIQALDALKFRILSKQDWFWREVFDGMDRTENAFSNPNAAQVWVDKGEQAIRAGDNRALREAVEKLWELQPHSAAQEVRQSALRSGLRS